MSDVSVQNRSNLEEMDPEITSIQPGGGVCMRLELAWGYLRRAYLKTFRAKYVERMRTLRHGDPSGCPHEVLDPRDLKFHRNQTDCHWATEDDPFAWRDRLPLVRAGLAEFITIGGGLLVLTGVAAWFFWPIAFLPAMMFLFIAWFFRNPRRVAAEGAGLVVSPADGRVSTIEEIEYDEYIGGPAVMIGIFLSIFNVHVNRVPLSVRVVGLSYRRGKFLNAMRPESSQENEQIAVRCEETTHPYRRTIVRQITGAIARRIVCWVRPGQQLARGEPFGMIKFGSRTELVLPRESDLVIEVELGQSVKAGTSIVARYCAESENGPNAPNGERG